VLLFGQEQRFPVVFDRLIGPSLGCKSDAQAEVGFYRTLVYDAARTTMLSMIVGS
jgi:hypothetical protein